MKEKIINIRNILKIIISLFIIFTMVKSCSKAYTIDDLIAYSEQITQMTGVPSAIKTKAQKVVQYKDTLKNHFQNFSADNSYIVYVMSNSDTISIKYISTTLQITQINSSAVQLNRNTIFNYNSYDFVQNKWYSGTEGASSFNLGSNYGLLNANYNAWESAPSTCYFNNKYTPPPIYTPLEFDDNFDNIVSYNGENARYYQR